MIATKRYLLFFTCFVALFFITCAYFIDAETHTIYGDDLALYVAHMGTISVGDVLNFFAPIHKFRPVSGMVNMLNMAILGKNLHNYFLFNISIQTLVTCVFALVLNLVLCKPALSLYMGCMLGLSRFAYYNVTQILDGGVSEGLALLFFLLFLYYILRILLDKADKGENVYKFLGYALLFANLAVYAHERYVVLFLFLFLFTLLFPMSAMQDKKKKWAIASASVFSIVLHYLLITVAAGLDYFPRKGSVASSFSFNTLLSSFQDGLLSIIQFNSGEARRVNISAASTPFIHQLFIFVIINILMVGVAIYTVQTYKALAAKAPGKSQDIRILYWILCLFAITFLPVLTMSRLENKWLQAPLAVFILLVVLIYSKIVVQQKRMIQSFFALWVIHFFLSDYDYEAHNQRILFVKRSEWLASTFKDAMNTGVIHGDTKNLYLLKDAGLPQFKNEMSWVLGNGKIFQFYQNKVVTMRYIENIPPLDKKPENALPDLKKETDQALTFFGEIKEITDLVINTRAKLLEHPESEKSNP